MYSLVEFLNKNAVLRTLLKYYLLYLPSCIYLVIVYIAWAILMVLFLYLYLSSFSFSYTFFAIINSFFSPIQVSALVWEKLYFFVPFKQIPS